MSFVCMLAALLVQGGAFAAEQAQSGPAATQPAWTHWPAAERIGCTHVAGRYNFTDKDFLNEGADRILESGMRVIKVYLNSPDKNYPFNSDWPAFRTTVQMARHPYYRALFDKPFKTFIMTTYSRPSGPVAEWRKGFTDRDCDQARRAFSELTQYLMRTYRGTGKTFVLQHWEGDWAVRGNFSKEPKDDPSEQAIEGMVRWLNARQDGVNQGRAAVRDSDVKVYHACEVNLVDLAMQGRPTVTNNVVPRTYCDLYSYSAYDTIHWATADIEKGRELFRKALDYLAAKAPDSPAFGDKNVYVGEFGWPEVVSKQDPTTSTAAAMNVIRMSVETALAWGCPYVVYWQVYDNESRVTDRRPTNDQVRGFYLIKPDGQRAAAWDYFTSLIAGGR